MSLTAETHAGDAGAVSMRSPTAADGERVWKLVKACPPLDENSLYCNLLQCVHFAGTCMLAEMEGEAVGWVSGYRPPERPEALFIWQVAVHEKARGRGLAARMIEALLQRDAVKGVTRIETTITPDNKSSWALFAKLADRLGAEMSSAVLFDREKHFGGRHESEHLVTIAPVRAGAVGA